MVMLFAEAIERLSAMLTTEELHLGVTVPVPLLLVLGSALGLVLIGWAWFAGIRRQQSTARQLRQRRFQRYFQP